MEAPTFRTAGDPLPGLLHGMATCAESASRETLACCSGWRADTRGSATASRKKCLTLAHDIYTCLRVRGGTVLAPDDACSLVNNLRDMVGALSAATEVLSHAGAAQHHAGVSQLAHMLHHGCVRLVAIMAQLASGHAVQPADLHHVHDCIEEVAALRKTQLEYEDAEPGWRAGQQLLIDQLRLAGSALESVAVTLDVSNERRLDATLRLSLRRSQKHTRFPS